MKKELLYPWTTENEFLGRFESLIFQQESGEVPSLPEWEQKYLDAMAIAQPREIVNMSLQLLAAAPREDVARTIDELLVNGPTDEGVHLLRRARKIFIVARDGLMVGGQVSHKDMAYDSLFKLCRTFGSIYDTDGVDLRPIAEARQAIRSQTAENYQPVPKREQEFQACLRKTTHLAYSMDAVINSVEDCTFVQYHSLRKSFRRISNVAILASLQHDDLTPLAQQCIVLNKYFGDYKDALENRNNLQSVM